MLKYSNLSYLQVRELVRFLYRFNSRRKLEIICKKIERRQFTKFKLIYPSKYGNYPGASVYEFEDIGVIVTATDIDVRFFSRDGNYRFFIPREHHTQFFARYLYRRHQENKICKNIGL